MSYLMQQRINGNAVNLECLAATGTIFLITPGTAVFANYHSMISFIE